jgi:hypothetical protein
MDNNHITLKLFKKNTDIEFIKEYIIHIDTKMIDVKNKILNDLYKNMEYNYIDLENITEKIYKDYGKLFFDIGIIPKTIDNYMLHQMTIGNRTFSFIVHPTIYHHEIKKETPVFLPKLIKETRMKTKINKNEFVYYDDEFPPLS